MFVAIRVDASATLGLGHLQRCLALAAALRDAGAKVVFVARRLGLDLSARLANAGFALRELAEPASSPGAMPPTAPWAGVDWAADASQTASVLLGPQSDWVVVDHYALDARWHRAVAQATGARLAVIDDLADRDLHASLLIDHNLATNHRYKYGQHLPPSTVLLGGPRFALLGPTYANAPRCSPREPVCSIGIFMGGTDPAGLSEVALRACRERVGFTGTVELVSTRANPRHAELAALATRWPDTHLLLDLPDLAAFFARHDLQIGAGGGASWERCCIGAPTLALLGADNQRVVLPELARLGALSTPDPQHALNADTVGEALAQLLAPPAQGVLATMGRVGSALVDGRGAQRVALAMAAHTLHLRGVTLADAEQMHQWRNHAATRSVSRSSSPIALADHRDWLQRTLADPTCSLQMGQVGSIDVGVIRFDTRPAASAEVSLYLDPALHGLGIGSALLRAGEGALRASHPQVRHFCATVIAGNTGSRRLFESAGYSFTQGHGTKPVDPALAPKETV
jgi:UDP-2,4-diacetamido-2,4,6-trideoxy-beta-L-altropyranose hydrolase